MGTAWASQTAATDPGEVKVHSGRLCPLMLLVIVVSLGIFPHALVGLVRATKRGVVHILVVVIDLGHITLVILAGAHVIHGRILSKHALG